MCVRGDECLSTAVSVPEIDAIIRCICVAAANPLPHPVVWLKAFYVRVLLRDDEFPLLLIYQHKIQRLVGPTIPATVWMQLQLSSERARSFLFQFLFCICYRASCSWPYISQQPQRRLPNLNELASNNAVLDDLKDKKQCTAGSASVYVHLSGHCLETMSGGLRFPAGICHNTSHSTCSGHSPPLECHKGANWTKTQPTRMISAMSLVTVANFDDYVFFARALEPPTKTWTCYWVLYCILMLRSIVLKPDYVLQVNYIRSNEFKAASIILRVNSNARHDINLQDSI